MGGAGHEANGLSGARFRMSHACCTGQRAGASSGNEVLEHVRAVLLALSLPKPHASRERTPKRAVFARGGLETVGASTAPGLNHTLRVCCKTRRVWQDA